MHPGAARRTIDAMSIVIQFQTNSPLVRRWRADSTLAGDVSGIVVRACTASVGLSGWTALVHGERGMLIRGPERPTARAAVLSAIVAYEAATRETALLA